MQPSRKKRTAEPPPKGEQTRHNLDLKSSFPTNRENIDKICTVFVAKTKTYSPPKGRGRPKHQATSSHGMWCTKNKAMHIELWPHAGRFNGKPLYRSPQLRLPNSNHGCLVREKSLLQTARKRPPKWPSPSSRGKQGADYRTEEVGQSMHAGKQQQWSLLQERQRACSPPDGRRPPKGIELCHWRREAPHLSTARSPDLEASVCTD